MPVNLANGETVPQTPAINWQQQANLVRSGQLGSGTTRQATAFQLSQLGNAGYMDLYPENYRLVDPENAMGNYQTRQLYQGGFDIKADLKGKIADWEEVLRQLKLSSSYVGAWLASNTITGLKKELALAYGASRSSVKNMQPKPLPIPDWMKPYLEPAIPYQKENVMGTPLGRKEQRYGSRQPQTASLRPLGAQAELTPEQMGYLSEYQAWGQAGSPKTFTDQMAYNLANQSKWWEGYTTKSQSLFPTAGKLRANWATAKQ
jgi:hypothetical protein